MAIIPGLPDDLKHVPPAPFSHTDPDADEKRAAWRAWRYRVMQYRVQRHKDLRDDPGLIEFERAKCAQHPAYWAAIWLRVYEPRWRVDPNAAIPIDLDADDPGANDDRMHALDIPDVPIFTQQNLMAVTKEDGTFDPANTPIFGWVPFICFDEQVEVINRLLWSLTQSDDNSDIVWSKCRGWGASWIGSLVTLWGWTFSDQWATKLPWNVLMLSRKEEYVDSSQQKSLFYKLRRMIRDMPEWQLPGGHKDNNLILQNLGNGNQITGESTNTEVGRGDRVTYAWIDEGAVIPDLLGKWATLTETTDHRWCVSTESFAQGRDFYELRSETDEGARPFLIESDWWRNPLNDDAWLHRQKRRYTLKEELYQQEIWRNPYTGSALVYGWARDIRADDSIEPRAGLPAYITVDPGFRDPTALIAVQEGANDELVVIDSYAEKGKEADFFIPLLKPEIFDAIDANWRDREYIEWTPVTDNMETAVTYAYQEREIAFARNVARMGRCKYVGDTYGENTVGATKDSVYSRWRRYGIHVNRDRKTGDGVTQTVKQGRTYKGRQEAMHETQARWRFGGTNGARLALKALKENTFPAEPDNPTMTEPQKPIHDWTTHYVSALEFLAVHIRQRHMINKRELKPANKTKIGGTNLGRWSKPGERKGPQWTTR